MKKSFILTFFLAFYLFQGIAQNKFNWNNPESKTLLLEKLGTHQRYAYRPGDVIKLKTKNSEFMNSYLWEINDSSISVGQNRPLLLRKIESVFPQFSFPKKFGMYMFIADEEMIVDVSREMLERLGYKVFTETDPVKAIEMFKEGPDKFDLVITDKTMPHMTGFDVVRAIKNIRADVPVLICSGYQEIGDMEKLTALGISQLITKPIRISSLSKAIRDALD